MGLGIPDALMPTGIECAAAFDFLPEGSLGGLARSLLCYEQSFASYDAIRALLEPRALRVGFHGNRFGFYALREASPADASYNILESDLYGKIGDPTDVYPSQKARALAPVDRWDIRISRSATHAVSATDPGASMRRGDNVRRVSGQGLLNVDLYSDDLQNMPDLGSGWKEEARVHLGEHEAEFLARRHGLVTITVSRPKGQHLRPGTLITLSNPWIYGASGEQGVSGVVGRVLRVIHMTQSCACKAEVMVFADQWRAPALYAPALWVESVTSGSATISTDADLYPEQTDGWTQPAWSAGGGGDLEVTLIRQLADGTWSAVGTAEVGSITSTTVTFSSPLTALPPDYAHTMLLIPSAITAQPAWAAEIYAGLGILGDNANTRRFS